RRPWASCSARSRCCGSTSSTRTSSTTRWWRPSSAVTPTPPAPPWRSTATRRPRSCVDFSDSHTITKGSSMPSSMHPGGPPQLTVDQLRAAVLAGEVDTVIVAFTDMQGRLQGKRIHGQFFIDHVLENGTEGCNYLLAVDVDMNTVGGYAMSSWERGYGDMFFEMDLTTLRRTPGHPASVTIQSDLTWLDGSGEAVQSPRTILKHQVEVAEAAGYAALAGTELEFILFEESYETAW